MEATAPPAPARYRIQDLVDVAQFDATMQAFHRATGILSALGDADGTILTSAGWQEACTRFHRTCPSTLDRCRESDRFIGDHLHDAPFAGYRCLNGLMDYAAPIMVEGQHVGTVYTGQFLHEPPDEESFRAQALEMGFDEAEYLSAIRRLPVVPPERIAPVMEYFSRLAESLATSGLERLRLREAEARAAAQLEALRASEARYRFLAENAVDVIWALDPTTGRFTYVSPSVERLRGYTAEEVMAEPVTAALTPDSQQTVLQGHPTVLGAITHDRAGPVVLTSRIDQPRRDGTIVPTEVVTKVITDPSGRPLEVLGVTRDITERLRAEEAVRNREELWKTLFAASPDGIVVADLDGTVVEVSGKVRTMFGYERDSEMVGRTLFEFAHPSDRDRARDLMRAVLAGENPGLTEFAALRRDWSAFFVEVHVEVLRGADGSPSRVFLVARDVTERKRADEELRTLHAELEERVVERTAALEEANRELEAFSYSVSHELRSPLRAIDGFAALVARRYETVLDEEGRRLFAQVRWNAQRMGLLIDDLLGFSRVGRTELSVAPVDMTAAAQGAFEQVASGAARSRISFAVDPLPVAQGDAVLLRRVWENLLSNAVKFSAGAQRPEVRVEGSREGKETVYRVRDNGAGFDMQYADKLFGVFHRLHGLREFEGTGVGLALVRRIVTRHGGQVWAEGAVGRGAVFSFSLPGVSAGR